MRDWALYKSIIHRPQFQSQAFLHVKNALSPTDISEHEPGGHCDLEI